MSALNISVLGGFDARFPSGEVLPLKGRKAQALLACLALTPGKRHTRDELANLLWSDRGEAQARSSLRQSLTELRKAMGERNGSLLIVGRDGIALDDGAIEVDAPKFERLIDDGSPAALEQAAALYRGELLESIDIKEPVFETWLRDERHRLHQRVCEGLSKLLEYQVADHDNELAIATARRLLALDPLNEASHRALMRLYAAAGDRAMGLRQFEVCRKVLQAELGLEPHADTRKLAAELRGARNDLNREKNIPFDANALHSPEEPLPMPDAPSIAVLPFVNLSADPEQEFFADSVTDDIITALSKINKLIVIARNSTFAYKGQPVDFKNVSREQGVRYVLEGSVRGIGDRVRVNAQLIDATTGRHLWAERYDRALRDIFAVQDEITSEIVIALDVRLSSGEKARLWSSGTKNLDAWECVRLADNLLDTTPQDGIYEARRLSKRALKLDPKYAIAWVILGWTYNLEIDVGAGHGGTEAKKLALGEAMDCAERALELDSSCSAAYSLLSLCHLSNGEYDQAVATSEKAIALAPHDADALAMCGIVYNKSGQPERSLKLAKKAIRLCPICPGWFLWVLGTAYRLSGKTELAVDTFRAGVKRTNEYLALHVGLASALGELERYDEAAQPRSEILRLNPDFSIQGYVRKLSYRNGAELSRFEEGLRKAGLPE